jgi:hypothetical protein
MICPSCGKELKEGTSFCTWCGNPVQAPAQMKAGKRWPYVFVLIAVVCIGVVLILGFAGPKWFLGEDGIQANPEETIDNYLEALENKDAASFLSLLDPEYIETVDERLRAAGAVTLEEAVSEDAFDYQAIRFEGIVYDTSINGNVATISIIDGTVTGTDKNGVSTTMDIEDYDFNEYRLVLKNGNWYVLISPTGFPG